MTTAAAPVDTSPAGITAMVRDIWDAAADGDYSYGNLDATDAQRQAWTILLRRLLPVERPLSILDLGCGSGSMTLILAGLGHTVTGLDVSPGMVGLCRKQADEQGFTDVALVEGDVAHPPPDLGPFDAVISRYLLWTLPVPQQAVAAWAGLVRPGGRVLAVDALWSEELVRATAGEEYPEEVLRILPFLHARDLEPVRNAWHRAGLGDLMAEELTWIDSLVRSEVDVHMRPMLRRWRYYLVEGTRPER